MSSWNHLRVQVEIGPEGEAEAGDLSMSSMVQTLEERELVSEKMELSRSLILDQGHDVNSNQMIQVEQAKALSALRLLDENLLPGTERSNRWVWLSQSQLQVAPAATSEVPDSPYNQQELLKRLWDLPLEAASSASGVPLTVLQDSLLIRGGDHSGAKLRQDHNLRVLVIAPACDAASEKRLKSLQAALEKSGHQLKYLCGLRAKWSAFETQMKANEEGYNWIVFIGHVEGESLTFATEESGEYRYGNGQQAFDQVPGEEVAKRIAEEQEHLQGVLLLGCQSWSRLSQGFINQEVPVLVCLHGEVRPDTMVEGTCSFFETLTNDQPTVEKAFLNLRQTLYTHNQQQQKQDDRWQGVLYVANASSNPHLQVIHDDPETRNRIKYCQGLRKKLSTISLLGMECGGNVPDLRRKTCCIYRVLEWEQQVEETTEEANQKKDEPQWFKHELKQQQLIEELSNKRPGSEVVQLGIEGNGGEGKTTVAETIAYELAGKFLEDPASSRLPVLVHLRDQKKLPLELVHASVDELICDQQKVCDNRKDELDVKKLYDTDSGEVKRSIKAFNREGTCRPTLIFCFPASMPKLLSCWRWRIKRFRNS